MHVPMARFLDIKKKKDAESFQRVQHRCGKMRDLGCRMRVKIEERDAG